MLNWADKLILLAEPLISSSLTRHLVVCRILNSLRLMEAGAFWTWRVTAAKKRRKVRRAILSSRESLMKKGLAVKTTGLHLHAASSQKVLAVAHAITTVGPKALWSPLLFHAVKYCRSCDGRTLQRHYKPIVRHVSVRHVSVSIRSSFVSS